MPTTECGFESRPDVLIHYGPTLYIEIGFDPPKTKTPRVFCSRRFRIQRLSAT